MKAKILDGKKLSERILKNLEKKTKELNLVLAVLLVGEDRVSKIFIDQKKRACEKMGISLKLFKFSEKINTLKLKKEIGRIGNLKNISGLIVQLPLPKKIETQEILNSIPLEKDLDCLSEKNLAKFYTGTSQILPPTVAAIVKLLKKYKISIKGKNVVMVGAGRLVGKPLSLWLMREGATLIVINEFTKNVPFFTKSADILISGAGKPNLIKGKMIKKGAVVIDAGASFKKGKLRGDVDFASCQRRASYIAPVPGGLGPLTVSSLIENLIKCQKK